MILALAAVLPEGLNLPLAGASAIVLAPLSYFLSQAGADFGKRLEPGLWRSWGGPPSTRFLRHSNTEFNAPTRSRIHTRLRELGLEVPTDAEEAADPQNADDLYASATNELKRRTRDTAKSPLVFKGLTEYGFRRNLLGLKRLGLLVAIAALTVSACAIWQPWRSAGLISSVPFVTALLTGSIILGWTTAVTPKAVKLTAERYALYLLEAALDLEP